MASDFWRLAGRSDTFGVPGNRAQGDEDGNLEGAGGLGRGKPTFRFFDTLEQNVTDGLKRFVRCARKSELAGSKPAGVTGRDIR